MIYERICDVVATYSPQIAVVESLFINNHRNKSTALSVAHARGVILLAISGYKLPTIEHTPLEIKHILTHYGRASKREVRRTVCKLLNCDFGPGTSDAFDALAASLAYGLRHTLSAATETSPLANASK